MTRSLACCPGDPSLRPDPPCASDREYCFVDFYDAAGHWLDRIVEHGGEDSVALDMRRIAASLAASHAPSILLRHGHPSGEAAPSQADIDATRALCRLAGMLGARLHDHVIEAGNLRFSFRDAGLL